MRRAAIQLKQQKVKNFARAKATNIFKLVIGLQPTVCSGQRLVIKPA